MFSKKGDHPSIEALPGIHRKTITWGEKTLTTEFFLEKGRPLPLHRHPQEQAGYMVSGRMILTIANEPFDVHPGDSWTIPGNIEHWVQVIEDTIVVEVFSPVREDYLPKM